MPDRPDSRFDAEQVQALAAVNGAHRRVEIEFLDTERRLHVVSLPVDAAIELGRLICDASEGTPFLPSAGSDAKRRRKT